ncbi:hypothetical protein [Paraburkholderia sediminicola]|uniref:hypothetical protein n=1 Tax=Paraburkholderia sediminicola TaxID=458836 RepID=UPI0038BD295C
MAKNQPAAKATKTATAKKAAAKVFDPALVPVMGYKLESFNIGRRRFHRVFTEIDGVAAAAIEIGEKDVAAHRKAGRQVAYVAHDLCVVTTDLSLVKKRLSEEFEDGQLAKVTQFYTATVGYPLLHGVHADEYENVSGTPYGLYGDCMDEEDFAIVDVEMAAKYERILAANAHYALNPLGEPGGLFDEHVPGRTLEAAILNFVVAAHEHDKYAKEWHDLAIEFSKVWKAKHGLSKVDHACPRYRAFTRAPWMQHKYHRGLAALARSYLSSVTERYAQASEVPFCGSAHAPSKKVAPQPLKLVPAKLPRLEEMDDSIPF